MVEVPLIDYDDKLNRLVTGITMHAVVQLVKPAEAFYEITTINKYENPTYAFKANSEAYDNGLANRNTKGGYMHAKVTCTYDSTEPQAQQIHCAKTANTSSKDAGGRVNFEWREKVEDDDDVAGRLIATKYAAIDVSMDRVKLVRRTTVFLSDFSVA
ncbi:hypothetical protein MMC29_003324 [Sticta canariensis]|nr:hypothetical protein [Sticta canariensis]